MEKSTVLCMIRNKFLNFNNGNNFPKEKMGIQDKQKFSKS